MSKFSALRHLRSAAGFTMIELLVVIAVIGVMAVAVLSALNPIEQINKGRDTSLRSDAEQLLSATERYFSIHELYPWNETRTALNPYNPATAHNGAALYDSAYEFSGPDAKTSANGYAPTDWNWIYQLSDTQEVKPAFSSRLITESRLIVLRPAGSNASTSVCFAPTSYAFRLEATRNCNPTAGGTQPATVAGYTVCATTDGTMPDYVTAFNYICLP